MRSRAIAFGSVMIPVLAAGVLLAGCSGQGAGGQAAAPAAAPAAPLPVGLTMLQLMRASVEIPNTGLGGLVYEEKPTDAQWSLMEQDATDLAAAATLISMPPTDAPGKAWVANADWQQWSKELQAASLEARAAAIAKNSMQVQAAGDKVAMLCEACHAKYRPQAPTDGVVKYPYYPARTLAPEG